LHDLIDCNQIQIDGVNNQGNKSIAPPNQNFQIFTNPMANHNISFVKPSETKNDLMNVDMDDDNIKDNKENFKDNMVVFIEFKPHKGQTNIPLDIDFSQNDIIKHVSDGPLYIARRINNKHNNGILNDLFCVENAINK
jgi:hypothetical protein